MLKLKSIIRTALLYSAIAVMLVGGHPVVTFADDGSNTTTATIVPPATTPKPPPTTYTYDSVTGRWSTNVWHYDATSGQYVKVTTLNPVEKPAAVPSDSTAPSTATPSVPVPVAPSSTQATNDTTGNGVNTTTTTNTLSGNATVSHNTSAGSATSGDATASATVVNAIGSSVSGSPVSFTSDINGDVNGDIELGPTIMKALSSATVSAASPISNMTVNSGTTNQITNTITLNTATGEATVSGNTNAGSATSGTANSVVNVMNIVNSIIAANESFIGTINIYGNLNGDILIAPDFIAQLLASNAGGQSPSGSLTVNSNNTQAITNNVNLSALTGAAKVTGNTSAGSATSGDAMTNVTILNLSGHQVVASNSLLVFVNVLGKWVGVIVDVPAGGTAAMLGDGVYQNIVGNSVGDSTINTQTNTSLTNNVDIRSQSGGATVANNTNAGNATSGNATASANILNIGESNIGLSGWFGILFINVFGTWLGSFGVNTLNGTPPAVSTEGTMPPQVFRFVPKASVTSFASHRPTMSLIGGLVTPPTPLQTTAETKKPAVLGASTPVSSNPTKGSSVIGYNASLIASVLGAGLLLGYIIRRGWLAVHINALPFIP